MGVVKNGNGLKWQLPYDTHIYGIAQQYWICCLSVVMDNSPAAPLHFSHLSGCRVQKPRAGIVSEIHLSSRHPRLRIRAKIMASDSDLFVGTVRMHAKLENTIDTRG